MPKTEIDYLRARTRHPDLADKLLRSVTGKLTRAKMQLPDPGDMIWSYNWTSAHEGLVSPQAAMDLAGEVRMTAEAWNMVWTNIVVARLEVEFAGKSSFQHILGKGRCIPADQLPPEIMAEVHDPDPFTTAENTENLCEFSMDAYSGLTDRFLALGGVRGPSGETYIDFLPLGVLRKQAQTSDFTQLRDSSAFEPGILTYATFRDRYAECAPGGEFVFEQKRFARMHPDEVRQVLEGPLHYHRLDPNAHRCPAR